MKKELPAWAYKIAIVVATIIWGYSFVSMKGVVAVIPPAWLLGVPIPIRGHRIDRYPVEARS